MASTRYFSIPISTLYQGASSSSVYRYSEVDWKNGVQNPMYRTQISDRFDATTALTGQVERYSVSSYPTVRGKVLSNPPSTQAFFTNNWGSPIVAKDYAITQQVDCSQLYVEAAAKSLSNAQNVIQNFVNPVQGQVILGELKELAGFLKNPLGKSVKLLEALAKAKGLRRAVSDSWLEFRFGILPLIGDVKSLLEVYNRELMKDELVGFKSYGASYRTYNETQTFGVVFQTAYERFLKWSWKVEDIYHFGILASKLDRANSLGESVEEFLSPKYLVPTAWELVPFSFLIDYFVNVGDIISATFSGRFDTTYCSHSVVTTKEAVLSFSPMRSTSSNVIVDPSSTPLVSYKLRTLSRAKGTLGVPPLVFSLPGSSVRYLNIAALLSNFTHQRR